MRDLIRRHWPIVLYLLAAVLVGIFLGQLTDVLAGFALGVGGTLGWIMLLPSEENDRG